MRIPLLITDDVEAYRPVAVAAAAAATHDDNEDAEIDPLMGQMETRRITAMVLRLNDDDNIEDHRRDTDVPAMDHHRIPTIMKGEEDTPAMVDPHRQVLLVADDEQDLPLVREIAVEVINP